MKTVTIFQIMRFGKVTTSYKWYATLKGKDGANNAVKSMNDVHKRHIKWDYRKNKNEMKLNLQLLKKEPFVLGKIKDFPVNSIDEFFKRIENDPEYKDFECRFLDGDE